MVGLVGRVRNLRAVVGLVGRVSKHTGCGTASW